MGKDLDDPTISVTIRDVASHARVSVGSVSRVLNGAPGIKAETRARVEAAVATLGYRPSKVAQSLATRTRRPVNVAPTAHLVTIGYLSADSFVLLNALPAPGSRMASRGILSFVGGPAANVAIAAHRLGGAWPVHAHVISSVGDDIESSQTFDTLLGMGVGVSGVERVPGGRLSRSIVLVEPCGRRTILNEPLTLPEPIIARHLSRLRLLTGTAHGLHFEGYRLGLADDIPPNVLSGAASVSLDTTGLDDPAQETPHALAALARRFGAIFVSKGFARRTLPAATDRLDLALDRALAQTGWTGGGLIVVDLGWAGASVLRAGEAPLHRSAPDVVTVDTTGAGDVFVGIFLAVRLNGGTLPVALEQAVTGAALSKGGIGLHGTPVTADRIARCLADPPYTNGARP